MRVFVAITKKGKVLFEEGDDCMFGTITKTKKEMVTYLSDTPTEEAGYVAAELILEEKEGK